MDDFYNNLFGGNNENEPKPEENAAHAEPAEPSEPVIPVQPEAPAEPEIPAEPEQPAQPQFTPPVYQPPVQNNTYNPTG
ncbi:MAG: hypothetical protein IKI33_00840, partial [Eubacterium sp.]|nr:hypothetical protein [Eubacterium sp.]